VNLRPNRFSLIVGLIFCLEAAASAQETGAVRGVVYDADFDVPLSNVRVVILETEQETTTSEQGDYLLPDVPAGEQYTLVFTKPTYARAVEGGVFVPADGFATVDKRLGGEFVEMAEFIVQDLQLKAGTEAAVLDLRFDQPGVFDAIGAETMSRAGASDAGDALRLVPGATVSEGKFAVIRGLPERYTSSKLNGVRMPSADRETRAVELDQFPSDVIESVQVSKTFTPDQQGDASGGAVNVALKGIPDQSFFEIGVGTEINTQAYGREDFLSSRGGGVNFWGLDDGRRAFPERRQPDNPNNPRVNFPSSVFGVSEDDTPPEYDFSVAGGVRGELADGVEVGAIANFFYERDVSFFDDGVRDDYFVIPFNGEPGIFPTGLEPGVTSIPEERETSLNDVIEGSEELQWGGLGTFGIKSEDHRFTFAFIHTRTTEDSATLLEDTRGRQAAIDDPLFEPPTDDSSDLPFTRSETLKYEERAIQSIQMSGEHTIPFPELELGSVFRVLRPEVAWNYAISKAKSDEPFERVFNSKFAPVDAFRPDGDPFHRAEPISVIDGSAQASWETMIERSDQYALDLKLPFEQWTESKGFIKFGIFSDDVTRTFTQDSFSNVNTGSFVASSNNPEFEDFLLSSEVDVPVGFPDNADIDYLGEQELSAWYWMVDLPLSSYFKMIGGLRYETTRTNVTLTDIGFAAITVIDTGGGNFLPAPLSDNQGRRQTFKNGQVVRAGPGDPLLGDVDFEQEDVLPSIGFVFEPIEQVTFRGAYTETVARQTFRELSVAVDREFLGGDQFIGNPDLQMSSVKNYDLRMDLRPQEGSLFSVSWFRKDIKDPIELIRLGTLGVGSFDFPVNFPEATVTGFEFEARQDMGLLWKRLEGLKVGANATFIDSEVTVPENLIPTLINSTTRPMTDAPDRLLNFNLTYDLEETGTRFGLFYTIKGETLVSGSAGSVSTNGAFSPSVYSTEFGTLNLTISQDLGKFFKLKFSAKNLTNPEIQEVFRSEVTPDVVHTSFRKGIDLSLSLSAEFTF